jgi:glutamyl-tRNA reductase
MKKILIVGGYGAVGRVIAKQLASSLPNPLVIAGRRLEPAQELAAELGPQPGSGLERSF